MTGGKVNNGNDKKKDVKKPGEKGRNALKGRKLLDDDRNARPSPDGTQSYEETARFCGKREKDPTFQEQLFGGGYLGTYVTAEGGLLHHTVGIGDNETLLKAFLDSCSDERVLKPGQTIEGDSYKITYRGFVNEPKEAVIDIKNKKTGKEIRTTVCQGVETPIRLPGSEGRVLVTVSACSEIGVSLTIKEK